MKTDKTATIDHYMNLLYTRVLRRDEEGDVIARIQELPGCIAHGRTDDEALANVHEMQRLWIQDCLESGHPVPEPEAEGRLPSGKWLQRVPRSIHKRLVRVAAQEGVSLNQLVTSMLSQSLIFKELGAGRTDVSGVHFSNKRDVHSWDMFAHSTNPWKHSVIIIDPGSTHTIEDARKRVRNAHPQKAESKKPIAGEHGYYNESEEYTIR
ncbi:MAG: toxin-antitoxin system HicB family antitoxin [Bryobacteraceae bacterium]